MIRIRKDGHFNHPLNVSPGDEIVLRVNGEEVHRTGIDCTKTVTYWACIEIGANGLAYVIGDKQTEADLKRMASI